MPLIGVTNCRKLEDYRQSVLHVGGEVRVLDPSPDIPAALEGLDGLLLTRGEDGMTLFRRGRALHVKAEKREVSDVTGAGDTVIATLAVMLACGADLPEAMHVANHAAGIVVGKLGTAVVHPDELAADLAGTSTDS